MWGIEEGARSVAFIELRRIQQSRRSLDRTDVLIFSRGFNENTIQGPALFIAQFIRDEPPFHSLGSIAAWAAGLGFKGLQLPSNYARFLNLEQATESKSYCEDLLATLQKHNLALTEISTHLQGQLVAAHPAFDKLFAAFGPGVLRDRPSERQAWATEQMILATKASRNLGLNAHATFSGALA